MKIIEVPKDLTVSFPTQNGPVEGPVVFKAWLQDTLDVYEPLGLGPKGARQALKIANAIEDANGTILLEDSDFDVVKAAVEKGKWRPGVVRQLVPFIEAVEKAEEVKKP